MSLYCHVSLLLFHAVYLHLHFLLLNDTRALTSSCLLRPLTTVTHS